MARINGLDIKAQFPSSVTQSIADNRALGVRTLTVWDCIQLDNPEMIAGVTRDLMNGAPPAITLEHVARVCDAVCDLRNGVVNCCKVWDLSTLAIKVSSVLQVATNTAEAIPEPWSKFYACYLIAIMKAASAISHNTEIKIGSLPALVTYSVNSYLPPLFAPKGSLLTATILYDAVVREMKNVRQACDELSAKYPTTDSSRNRLGDTSLVSQVYDTIVSFTSNLRSAYESCQKDAYDLETVIAYDLAHQAERSKATAKFRKLVEQVYRLTNTFDSVLSPIDQTKMPSTEIVSNASDCWMTFEAALNNHPFYKMITAITLNKTLEGHKIAVKSANPYYSDYYYVCWAGRHHIGLRGFRESPFLDDTTHYESRAELTAELSWIETLFGKASEAVQKNWVLGADSPILRGSERVKEALDVSPYSVAVQNSLLRAIAMQNCKSMYVTAPTNTNGTPTLEFGVYKSVVLPDTRNGSRDGLDLEYTSSVSEAAAYGLINKGGLTSGDKETIIANPSIVAAVLRSSKGAVTTASSKIVAEMGAMGPTIKPITSLFVKDDNGNVIGHEAEIEVKLVDMKGDELPEAETINLNRLSRSVAVSRSPYDAIEIEHNGMNNARLFLSQVQTLLAADDVDYTRTRLLELYRMFYAEIPQSIRVEARAISKQLRYAPSSVSDDDFDLAEESFVMRNTVTIASAFIGALGLTDFQTAIDEVTKNVYSNAANTAVDIVGASN